MSEDDVNAAVVALGELLEDTTLPKSVRASIKTAQDTLNKGKDKVSVNRALSCLEEVADGINMQAEHRTALFNVISLLESV